MPKTRKSKEPETTPAEAMEILESALGYCRKAGMKVRAANGKDGLLLSINPAYVKTMDGAARLFSGTPAPLDVPEITTEAVVP